MIIIRNPSRSRSMKTILMFSCKIILLCLLFSCQEKQVTSDQSAPSSLPNEEQQNTDLERTSSANLKAKDFVYGWVDNLNIRETPTLSSKILTTVQSKDPLEFTGENSEKNQTIVLRGIAYEEPWLKVITPDRKEGWVFGGAIKLKNEIKGNGAINETNFDFPHFGSFNLKDWKRQSTIDESGGDADIETRTYKKGDQLLIISIIDGGDYGYGRIYQLMDANRILFKERQLNFSADETFHELNEEVKDFTVDPPIQFTRIQKLKKHHSQLNALPMMVNGNWTKTELEVKEAPKDAKIQSFNPSDCEYVNMEVNCFCDFRTDENNEKSTVFVTNNIHSACINLNGEIILVLGGRIDNRAELYERSLEDHWITLKKRGGMTIFGESANMSNYDECVDILVQTLLVMDEFPDEIPIKNNAEGMAIREVRDICSDAITLAKSKRQYGNTGPQMEMHFQNDIYDILISGIVKSKNDNGGETYEGTMVVRTKKGKILDSQKVWGYCGC